MQHPPRQRLSSNGILGNLLQPGWELTDNPTLQAQRATTSGLLVGNYGLQLRSQCGARPNACLATAAAYDPDNRFPRNQNIRPRATAIELRRSYLKLAALITQPLHCCRPIASKVAFASVSLRAASAFAPVARSRRA